MKRKVIYEVNSATTRAAAQKMIQNRIGTLPILDNEDRMVGLMQMRHLITLAMPDFVNLLENVDFVPDFGAVENECPTSEMLDLPVSEIMGEPVSIEESSGLLRAMATIQEHDLTDIPVVDSEMRLLGIASNVDIGVMLMSNWDL
jgi:CBS-domain-containing membrane protein